MSEQVGRGFIFCRLGYLMLEIQVAEETVQKTVGTYLNHDGKQASCSDEWVVDVGGSWCGSIHWNLVRTPGF